MIFFGNYIIKFINTGKSPTFFQVNQLQLTPMSTTPSPLPKIWIIYLGRDENLNNCSFHAIIVDDIAKELAINRAKKCFVNNIKQLEEWETFDSLFNDLCHERSQHSTKSPIVEYLELSVKNMTDLPKHLQDFYKPAIKDLLVKSINDLDPNEFSVVEFDPTRQTSQSYVDVKPLR